MGKISRHRLLGLLGLLLIVLLGTGRAVGVIFPIKPTPGPSPSTPPGPATPPPPAPAATGVSSSNCAWVAVSIDNSIPARPQTGLLDATIVYEFPAEGGITRLLAFYCEGAPEVVGPVRSVRIYMLDLAREYGAVVAHSGHSSSALEMIRKNREPVINEFWQSQPFRRDRRRKMPHNLYTSIPALRRALTSPLGGVKLPWDTANAPIEALPTKISIPYGLGYDVGFIFDPQTGTYLRTVAKHPMFDRETKAELRVANVLIQYAHWWQTYEDRILESRIDLVGTGAISLFTGGRRIDGRWSRADAKSQTIFTDSDGHSLELRPGLTWVNIVPSDRSIQVEPRPKTLVQ